MKFEQKRIPAPQHLGAMPRLGFKRFRCARIILGGIELMHMVAKGEMAFGVVVLFGHHRAAQVEIDRVEPACIDGGNDLPNASALTCADALAPAQITGSSACLCVCYPFFYC